MLVQVGEGSSPDAATGGQQPVPSRQQTTAQRRVRRKWSQEDNRRVMECYYQSMRSRNGYRKRMLQIWVEKGLFQVTEQWLSELELEEIRRLIEEGEDTGEVGGSEEDEETDRSEQEEVRTDPQLNKQNAQSRKLKIVLVEGCELSPEEVEVIKKLEKILPKKRERLPSLRGIERRKLKEVTKKVDAVREKIETNDITNTNDLMYAGAAVVTDLVGVKRGNR